MQYRNDSLFAFDYDVSRNNTGSPNQNLYLYNSPGQQSLQETLYDESCQKYGIEVIWISRQDGDVDGILGEDYNALYSGRFVFPLTIFPLDFTNYNPETFFERSQPTYKDKARFHIVKKRFTREADIHLGISDLQPQVGDLFQIKMTGDLFTVNFNEPESQYYDQGKAFVWEFRCIRKSVDGDNYDTGIESIDDTQFIDNLDYATDPEKVTGDNLRIEQDRYQTNLIPTKDAYGGL